MTIVTPSYWLADIMKESFLKECEITTIHNGINLTNFKPIDSEYRKRYNLEGKKILVAVASTWNEMKGDEMLDKIADLLDDSYKIIMIGNKRKEPQSKRIISLPRTKNVEELAKWYSTAAVFINPTLGDNFPTVNIEAFACGTPIVTNDTGGSPEVAGNKFGRIVYSRTPEEFAQKIKECIGENYSTKDCRNAALAFDGRNAYKKYIALYRKVIDIR